MDPGLEVLPAPLGIDVWRPGYRERVHAIFMLEYVRGVARILASRAWYQTIVVAIVAPVAVAQILKFTLTLVPVDGVVLFLGDAAGIAHPVSVEMDGRLATFPGVRKLHR